MILNSGGLVIPLYGEHIRQDTKYNVAGMTDDYATNAIDPATPTQNTLTRPTVYNTQSVQQSWVAQLAQQNTPNYQT